MTGMNGLSKPTNYVKNNYIREASNVSNVHPKKPSSGISYFMSFLLWIYPFSNIKSLNDSLIRQIKSKCHHLILLSTEKVLVFVFKLPP